MKILVFLLTLTVSVCSFAKGSKTEFGEKLTMKKAVSLEKAIASFSPKSNDTQLIEAQVTKVCKSKGCWMGLKSNTKRDVRVTFHDYSFFVPQHLVGKTVLVQGKIKEKQMTLKETKHYVEDEGGDPSKVTKPGNEYRIVATGLKVKST